MNNEIDLDILILNLYDPSFICSIIHSLDHSISQSNKVLENVDEKSQPLQVKKNYCSAMINTT